VFVTERKDLNTWCQMALAPVDWLPWGSDVLNLDTLTLCGSLIGCDLDVSPKNGVMIGSTRGLANL